MKVPGGGMAGGPGTAGRAVVGRGLAVLGRVGPTGFFVGLGLLVAGHWLQ